MRSMSRFSVLAVQVAIVAVSLALWEWGEDLRRLPLGFLVPGVIDPFFISKPSVVWQRFLELGCFTDWQGNRTSFSDGSMARCLASTPLNLWGSTLATLRNTFWGFAVGVSSGVAVGLLLGRSDWLARVFEPFIIAFNSLPRIALVPLIILMFGLGDASKIMTAWVIVFFLVFFNTFEGARAVSRDHIAAARLMGANAWQVTWTVIVPGTMAWVFATLSPAVSFSLIGVIVGEFIGAEQGLGKMIVYAQATANAADMMVALVVLMIIGVVLSLAIRQLQAYLLRWEPRYQAG